MILSNKAVQYLGRHGIANFPESTQFFCAPSPIHGLRMKAGSRECLILWFVAWNLPRIIHSTLPETRAYCAHLVTTGNKMKRGPQLRGGGRERAKRFAMVERLFYQRASTCDVRNEEGWV